MGTDILNIKMCLSTMMVICIKQHLEAKFVKKLSNTEDVLKKSVAYIKSVYSCLCSNVYNILVYFYENGKCKCNSSTLHMEIFETPIYIIFYG